MRLRIPQGHLAAHLGMSSLSPMSGRFRPPHFGVVLDRGSIEALQVTTGLGPSVFAPTLLSTFDGSLLDLSGLDPERAESLRPVALRAWADFQGSRICPACVAEGEGVWKLWWRLSLAAVCPTHQLMLSDRCPGCEMGWGRGSPRGGAGLSRKLLPDNDRCMNLKGNRPCGMPYEQVAAVAAPEGLVDVQQRMFAWFEDPRLAGERVPAPQQVVTALCHMLRIAADTDRFAAAGHTLLDIFVRDDLARFRPTTTATPARSIAPTTVAAATCLQVGMDPLLTADSPERFRKAVADLAVVRGHEGRNVMRQTHLPGAAGQIWMEEQARSARFSARSRPHTVQIATSRIPHLVPDELYDGWVAALVPGTARVTGRRFAAFAVARVAGANSWPRAVAALDAPPEYMAICDVVARRVDQPDLFWRSVATVAQDLALSDINYAARRRQADSFDRVPDDVWAQVCAANGLVNTAASARNAAAWVWTDWTGGHWADAPALRNVAGIDTESARETYRRFVRRVPHTVFTALHSWAVAQWEGRT